MRNKNIMTVKTEYPKLLGTAELIMLVEEEAVGEYADSTAVMRYDTMIQLNKPDKPIGTFEAYVTVLKRLGFYMFDTVVEIMCHGGIAHVYLPVGWTHFKMDDTNDVILDNKGRMRAVTENGVTTFMTKYAIEASYVDNSSKNKPDVVKIVIFKGKTTVATIQYTADKLKEKLKEDNREIPETNTEEFLNDYALELYSNVMDIEYPEWRFGWAYWD